MKYNRVRLFNDSTAHGYNMHPPPTPRWVQGAMVTAGNETADDVGTLRVEVGYMCFTYTREGRFRKKSSC